VPTNITREGDNVNHELVMENANVGFSLEKRESTSTTLTCVVEDNDTGSK
jgi:hypothetical protein